MSEELDFVIKIGDQVEPDPTKTNYIFHCGTGRYATAVVVSLDPFVMVSLSGEMMWFRWNPDHVRVVSPTSYRLEPITQRLQNEMRHNKTKTYKEWFDFVG